MPKQPRENRVPIMFSTAELNVVDDWRFASRVATRSDAVRKLAQIGVVYSKQIDEILASIRQAAEVITAMNHALAVASVDDAGGTEAIAAAVDQYFDALRERVLHTQEYTIQLAERMAMIQQTVDLAEAIEITSRAHREAAAVKPMVANQTREIDE